MRQLAESDKQARRMQKEQQQEEHGKAIERAMLAEIAGPIPYIKLREFILELSLLRVLLRTCQESVIIGFDSGRA